MAITATDILFKFSVVAAAGNTTAGTAATSLGDQISTTQITDATLNNLFDDVSGDENAASDVVARDAVIEVLSDQRHEQLFPNGVKVVQIRGRRERDGVVCRCCPSYYSLRWSGYQKHPHLLRPWRMRIFLAIP